MEEELHIEDGSNDRAYFTMVPNIVLNHSSAIDQALYMQMKRFAGEKSGGGYCTASHRTLMSKLGIGPKALKTSIQYLIDHRWIENTGARKVMTDGGPQDVQVYRVNDIWRLNVNHYKGADESTPLKAKGADERSKGGDESAPTKNNTKKINTSVANAPRVVSVSLKEEEDRPKSAPKYPNARTAFSWFPNRQPSWDINTTELAHGELLFLRGEHQVRLALDFVKENRDDEFCPKVVKPSDLERKWLDLLAYRNKIS